MLVKRCTSASRKEVTGEPPTPPMPRDTRPLKLASCIISTYLTETGWNDTILLKVRWMSSWSPTLGAGLTIRLRFFDWVAPGGALVSLSIGGARWQNDFCPCKHIQ